MNGKERVNLVAPCGLYCGACSTYVARKRGDEEALDTMAKRITEHLGVMIKPEDDLICNGCLSSQVAVFCRRCALRACAIEKKVTYCVQCSDFPCQILTDFNNDGRPHHSEVLANVRRQQEIGINAWLDEQEKRWRCPDCGCVIGWYDIKCPQCSVALIEQFK